ncbi:MAG TPA: glycoside hydrolase [Clostridiaceae bacterium]|nr:glycoside hydrolase [Clostridiaceae bacterium]
MRRKATKAAAIILILVTFIVILSPAVNGVDAQTKRFNMSYIYFGKPSTYSYYVDRTKGSLNEISPSYFNINSEGNLEIDLSFDTNFINEMHARGVKVVPFLSNHWDRSAGRNALSKREALAQQIATVINKYNLDGVNVDIENLTEADRENYTDFIRILRNKLGYKKSLSVAVAPNPYNISKGWQGSYDYAALAKYSDYLMIMAYDESYQGGPAGPVASASFVERSIEHAIERVPKNKIVLGIPFYGRLWKNDGSYGGYGVSNATVEQLIQKYNGKVTYDKNAQTPKAVITIKAGDQKPTILGKKLDAGTYTIWYENEQSIKYKLSLVQKYDIKGTGSWSLGQETADTWSYYDRWLNGRYFTDSEGHWAEKSIFFVEEKGWMNGVSSTKFAPDKVITRAEVAAVLVRALELEGDTSGTSFKDTSKHWARNEIEIARQNNIVIGVGDGNFLPDNPVTRQEIAVMLDRILSLPDADEEFDNPYWDITYNKFKWSYDSILKMTYNGIFTGGTDGGFHPYEGTTRAQMAVLMERISKYIEVK